MLDYLNDENEQGEENFNIDDIQIPSLDQIKHYKSVKGDKIDEAIGDIFDNLKFKLPVIRIE